MMFWDFYEVFKVGKTTQTLFSDVGVFSQNRWLPEHSLFNHLPLELMKKRIIEGPAFYFINYSSRGLNRVWIWCLGYVWLVTISYSRLKWFSIFKKIYSTHSARSEQSWKFAKTDVMWCQPQVSKADPDLVTGLLVRGSWRPRKLPQLLGPKP